MGNMGTTGSRRSDSLQRLRELCTELNDKDNQLKKDLQLFEGFFDNFPIPVTMWMIGKDHTVLSKRGNAFTCQEAKTLEEIFKCPMIRSQSIEKHEQALTGDTVSYFVEDSNHVYWTRLVPRIHDDGSIIGVTGIAWDVTTNAIMLASLENIVDLIDSKASLEKIREEVDKGISCSRLKKMLEEEESINV